MSAPFGRCRTTLCEQLPTKESNITLADLGTHADVACPSTAWSWSQIVSLEAWKMSVGRLTKKADLFCRCSFLLVIFQILVGVSSFSLAPHTWAPNYNILTEDIFCRYLRIFCIAQYPPASPLRVGLSAALFFRLSCGWNSGQRVYCHSSSH